MDFLGRRSGCLCVGVRAAVLSAFPFKLPFICPFKLPLAELLMWPFCLPFGVVFLDCFARPFWDGIAMGRRSGEEPKIEEAVDDVATQRTGGCFCGVWPEKGVVGMQERSGECLRDDKLVLVLVLADDCIVAAAGRLR